MCSASEDCRTRGMLKGVVDAYYLKRIETLYYAGEKYGCV